jgi:hypothetical protein
MSEGGLIESVAEITRIFRVAMKSAVDHCQPDTLLTLEGCWKSLVYIFDTTLLTNKERIHEAIRDTEARTKQRTREKLRETEELLEQWKHKLNESKTENAKLTRAIERLRQDR